MVRLSKMEGTLFFDIETSLMPTWTHYIGNKVSMSHKQVEQTKRVICICYKWGNDSTIYSLAWDPKYQDDTIILNKFNEIAGMATTLIGHNAQKFDVRELRAHMALRGIRIPWCETAVFDTLTHFRRVFALPSNRLDAVAQWLGLGHKSPMDMDDWLQCSRGQKETNDALTRAVIDLVSGYTTVKEVKLLFDQRSKEIQGATDKMVKYCKKDVQLLADCYSKLERYIPETIQTRNLKSYTRTMVLQCQKCEGALCKRGFTHTKRYGTLQRYMCVDCGRWSQDENI